MAAAKSKLPPNMEGPKRKGYFNSQPIVTANRRARRDRIIAGPRYLVDLSINHIMGYQTLNAKKENRFTHMKIHQRRPSCNRSFTAVKSLIYYSFHINVKIYSAL